MFENVLLVWIDPTIDVNSETFDALRRVVNDIHPFTAPHPCLTFIADHPSDNIFLITSGYLGEELLPHLDVFSQLKTIFIFTSNPKKHQSWSKHFSKIDSILFVNLFEQQ